MISSQIIPQQVCGQGSEAIVPSPSHICLKTNNHNPQEVILITSCAQNIQAVGVVVADVATEYSHWTAVESLSEWCAREGVVCRVPVL